MEEVKENLDAGMDKQREGAVDAVLDPTPALENK